MTNDLESLLFSKQYFMSAVTELNSWIHTTDIVSAARLLEEQRRAKLDPKPSASLLSIVFPDDDAFETVFIRVLDAYIAAYACPAQKIEIARSIEPSFSRETFDAIEASKFSPNIKRRLPGTGGLEGWSFEKEAVREAAATNRMLFISDKPHVLELVRRPLSCIRELVGASHEFTKNLPKLRASSGERPFGIQHEVHTEGPLPAIIEASFFYCRGLDVGYAEARDKSSLIIEFRHVAMVQKPPIDKLLAEAALEETEQMLARFPI